MREIKFRVWDELNKCYDGCYLPGFNGEILEFDKDGTYKNVQNGNKIVEQYLGVKDKNKKEIYEGDIIEWDDECSSYNGIYECKKSSAVISWSCYHSKFVLLIYDELFEFYSEFDEEEYEVIGNIHEGDKHE